MHNSRLRCLQLQLLKNWSSRIGSGGGIGLRSISQARVNFSEEDQKNYNVWQNWVISILKESEAKEKANQEGNKDGFLKRPSVDDREKYRHRLRPNSTASLALSNENIKARRAKMARKEPLDDKIIWVDCEMTGLDPAKDQLMEIGMIITDGELNVIAQQDSVVFHIDEPSLAGMTEWCQKHHGESGLIDACRKSVITHEEADDVLLRFVQQHTSPGECPMGGNSVGQDKVFVARQLPKLHSHFHYRVVDVSTLKELVRRWYPEAYAAAPKKKFAHRVLDDIKESITELKYYRSAVLLPPEENCKSAKQTAE